MVSMSIFVSSIHRSLTSFGYLILPIHNQVPCGINHRLLKDLLQLKSLKNV